MMLLLVPIKLPRTNDCTEHHPVSRKGFLKWSSHRRKTIDFSQNKILSLSASCVFHPSDRYTIKRKGCRARKPKGLNAGVVSWLSTYNFLLCSSLSCDHCVLARNGSLCKFYDIIESPKGLGQFFNLFWELVHSLSARTRCYYSISSKKAKGLTQDSDVAG